MAVSRARPRQTDSRTDRHRQTAKHETDKQTGGGGCWARPTSARAKKICKRPGMPHRSQARADVRAGAGPTSARAKNMQKTRHASFIGHRQEQTCGQAGPRAACVQQCAGQGRGSVPGGIRRPCAGNLHGHVPPSARQKTQLLSLADPPDCVCGSSTIVLSPHIRTCIGRDGIPCE
jgi:hypothetical protein